jgi:hypothetical protein
LQSVTIKYCYSYKDPFLFGDTGAGDMVRAGSRGLLILVTISLMVSIFTPMGMIGNASASGPTYVPHSTIHIDNNNNLLSLRAAGGSLDRGP